MVVLNILTLELLIFLAIVFLYSKYRKTNLLPIQML
jgi:hypothetical protein